MGERNVGQTAAAGEGLTPAPPYSAVVFDCDGTLVDTIPVHYRALSEVLTAQGIALDHDWLVARTGVSTRELLGELSREEVGRGLDVEKALTE